MQIDFNQRARSRYQVSANPLTFVFKNINIFLFISIFAILLIASSQSIHADEAQDPNYDKRLATNIVIVFDASGSMRGTPLQIAQNSVSAFFKKLPENWNVGLVVFDRAGIRKVFELGKHSSKDFDQNIQSIRAGGATPLGRAIFTSYKMLKTQREKQQGYGHYRVVIVTDGEASDKNVMNQVCKELLGDGLSLNVIGYRLKSEHSLRDFATDYREAGDQEQLTRALQKSVAEVDTEDENFAFEPLFQD